MIVEQTDYHNEPFLEDLPEMPTDQDLLEVQQKAILQEQENDLLLMKNNCSLNTGNFACLYFIAHKT